MPRGELDIAKNIKMIEGLQCELLSLISQLFCSMQDGKETARERVELLANMEVMIYLLANRLGISCQLLDQKVVSRLKLGILEEEDGEEWKDTLRGILRHIDKTRE